MPKLSNKSARRIADLVNQIEVAELMLSARDKNGQREYDFDLWMRDRCQAKIALRDEFGIHLVGVGSAQDWLDCHPQDADYAI